MNNSKQEFGQFVATHRRTAGLTQRQLAERLFVTESAVSKWERGLSYPDIASVRALAAELGVTTDELMSASVDHEVRSDKQDARTLRRTRGGLVWSLSIAYALSLVTCFIVNISVSHRLDWFWEVLAVIAFAASLTLLPLLRVPARGWLVLAAATATLLALLGVTAVLYGGGAWVPVTVSAILLGVTVCFGPLWLSGSSAPSLCRRHAVIWALLLDSVALVLFLLVTLRSLGLGELFLTRALPIAAIGAAPFWLGAIALRYLPWAGLFRAAAVLTLAAVYAFFVQGWVNSVLGGQESTRHIDLLSWQGSTIEGNITLLSSFGLLTIAGALAIAGRVRARQS